MKFNFSITNSAFKYILDSGAEIPEIKKLVVFKNEEFSFQFLIESDEQFTLTKKRIQDISWVGLCSKVRTEIVFKNEKDEDISDFFSVNIMDYLVGDEEEKVLDLLSPKATIYSEYNAQGILITGKLPKDFSAKNITATIEVFYTKDYADEKSIYKDDLDIKVLDYECIDIAKSDFYLDLWQHPCNWARAYDFEYYSEEHFNLIDRYIEKMALIGQKVCDLIISDYSWAGQRCYKVFENHNNLFELNIVKVSKKEGNFICDFSSFDRYIEICKKYDVFDEINLFGILCNWDAYDFGNPLEDFADPIRVSYFDEDKGVFRYINTKAELIQYLSIVFEHIYSLGYWEKTLVMSDEPANIKLFNEAFELLQEAAGEKKIYLKCAIHNQDFFDENSNKIKSLSLNTCELVNNIETLEKLKRQIEKSGGKLTWYSCCFPTDLNIFLSSPLIESRIKGWFTYYMGMDGFLRWAYGIWPGNVFSSASYKKEKWNAGDMFFVCNGKTIEPLETLRLKNFIYGIQDFNFFREVSKYIKPDWIDKELEKVLGNKRDMKFVPEREVAINYSLSYDDYEEVRLQIYEKYLQAKTKLDRIANAIVDMDEDNIEKLIQDAINSDIIPESIYQYGLSEGMAKVTEMFEKKKYFVSEVIVCADTLNKGVNFLKNFTTKDSADPIKVILSVVEGDLHEIGKNVVKIMFEASGFKVIDMGINVKAEDIVKKAIEENANIIGLSTMMTTTMPKIKDVVDIIKDMKIDDDERPKVIIGGGPVTQRYSLEIGSDGYSSNAVDAVKLVNFLVAQKKI